MNPHPTDNLTLARGNGPCPCPCPGKRCGCLPSAVLPA